LVLGQPRELATADDRAIEVVVRAYEVVFRWGQDAGDLGWFRLVMTMHQGKPPALVRDNSDRLAIIFQIIYIIAISMPQTKIDLITGKLDLKHIIRIAYR
jgi:hypothetical protein